MRGDNGQGRGGQEGGDRFTPTCVGTIIANGPTWPLIAVHPHMRGDNDAGYFNDTNENGSPPHAWGQSLTIDIQYGELRFTPTCVGTIGGAELDHHSPAVHPHMRGDNSGKRSREKRGFGSPPHAWGQ